LPDGPIAIQSAVQAHRNLRLVVIKGLTHPWGMAFLPDGNILITERPGCLRIVRNGVLDPKVIAGLPPISPQGLSGLMDIALHPRFAENKFVYLTYHKPNPAAAGAPAWPRWSACTSRDARSRHVGRQRADERQGTVRQRRDDGSVAHRVRARRHDLHEPRPIDRRARTRRRRIPGNYGGKLLRLRDDGTVPPDNPFVGKAGYKPEIYTLGHRNQLGLAVNPESGQIWASENGPNGGDEVNIIQAGKNYGWPVISQGRSYAGPRVSDQPVHDGMEQPHIVWIPAIANLGDDVLHRRQIPGVEGQSVRRRNASGRSPAHGATAARRVQQETGKRCDASRCCASFGQRIRDVRQGPDGYLYVLTEENDAALIRIEPAETGSTK
jgi:glucose/arabinose dehydrogenase